MFDSLLLKSQMTLKNMSVDELAKRIQINPATLHRKLGNGNFTRNEIEKVSVELNLDKDMIMNIFFN